MRTLILAVSMSAMIVPTMPAAALQSRSEWHQDRREAREDARTWRRYRNWDYNRVDPQYGYYDAGRYYRNGRYYSDRRLSRRDRIYRGRNGRYYCRRSDGTTGLIIGAALGGLLGNQLATGRSATIETLIGASAGALLGRELARGRLRCD